MHHNHHNDEIEHRNNNQLNIYTTLFQSIVRCITFIIVKIAQFRPH